MIPELISNYLDDNNLSYRAMAAKISWQLGIPNAITDQAIYLWAKGANKPRPTLMQLLSKQGNGSLKALADEILKELESQPVQS